MSTGVSDELERRTLARVVRRLVPFMILLYLLNYLDRVNINVAKLEMNKDLGMDDQQYGFGASIFFLGYCTLEIPSNLIMQRIGARLWIARIMFTWGLISTGMMFVGGAKSFYLLRMLLGAAEAGFFPGMILYLSFWIPARQRAQAGAWFLTSTALSGVIGQPLAALIMTRLNHVRGLEGWRWLFFVEGVPTLLMGLIVLLYLTDRPEQAKWLAEDERAWLSAKMKNERERLRERCGEHGHSFLHAFSSSRVWVLCIVYSTMLFGFYALQYWIATIVKMVATTTRSSADLSEIGLLCAIPFFCAAAGMVLIGLSSDRRGERCRHVAGSALLGCVGLVWVCQVQTSLPMTIAALSLAAVGIFGTLGPFWAIPSSFLSDSAAAAGVALINSVGNFAGGFVGPIVMGKLLKDTNSYVIGIRIFAAALFVAACIALALAPSYDKAVASTQVRDAERVDLPKELTSGN